MPANSEPSQPAIQLCASLIGGIRIVLTGSIGSFHYGVPCLTRRGYVTGMHPLDVPTTVSRLRRSALLTLTIDCVRSLPLQNLESLLGSPANVPHESKPELNHRRRLNRSYGIWSALGPTSAHTDIDRRLPRTRHLVRFDLPTVVSRQRLLTSNSRFHE